MKACVLVALLAVCTGCITQQSVVTRQRFEDINLGTTVADFEECLGKPYATHKKKNGVVEYEYIERIPMGDEIIEERHYFFTVSNGKVIRKRVSSGNQPNYNEIYQDDPNQTEF